MHSVVLAHAVDWHGWRVAARALVQNSVPPDAIVWSVAAPDDLFAAAAAQLPAGSRGILVPRALVSLAQTVIQAREPARFALLYRLLWRTQTGERHLLDLTTDPEVIRANRLAQAVRRDTHKMRAFLRFREVTEDGATRYVAWFEPTHFIVQANAAFFVRRFAGMTWSILTPECCAHWDGADIAFTPGTNPADVPDDDRLAAYWRVYFAAIFNPARLKLHAMNSEMPRKYWRNLPEAADIGDLVRAAPGRVATMIDTPKLSPPRPTKRMPRPLMPRANSPLSQARQDAATCQRCALCHAATQTVFGEGPTDAAMMLMGEQPGDQEDLAGRPFVGPAGQVLDRALAEAGLVRSEIYITNAVKHFKFVPRGKRRIHASPTSAEITACRPWLDIERAEISPKVMLLLGASAARAVLGHAAPIRQTRGTPMILADTVALITFHPAHLLRLPEQAARTSAYAAFVTDLRHAAALVAAGARGPHL